jgi:hypothetical protein
MKIEAGCFSEKVCELAPDYTVYHPIRYPAVRTSHPVADWVVPRSGANRETPAPTLEIEPSDARRTSSILNPIVPISIRSMLKIKLVL